MTEQESEQRAWYYLLLPVILTACTVFAVLTAVNRFDLDNFFWYWSAILGAASSFAFTAAFGTPLGKLARRLQRDGCAVASYSGAAMMSRKGSMVLTDSDLFPPGTVFMNGMKVYAHDAIQAVSYASSLMTASGCGLRQVFDDLCRSQGGHTYPVEDFSFYQEGGVAGTIRGESVLVGRADFMAQMGVRLPREIKLKTGVFLAVDKELVAVFAVKYMASDNVDAALQAILHNGIRPVFAVRDFNITPALIKRKFRINTKKRCLYPELSDRPGPVGGGVRKQRPPRRAAVPQRLDALCGSGHRRQADARRRAQKLRLGADRQHLRHASGLLPDVRQRLQRAQSGGAADLPAALVGACGHDQRLGEPVLTAKSRKEIRRESASFPSDFSAFRYFWTAKIYFPARRRGRLTKPCLRQRGRRAHRRCKKFGAFDRFCLYVRAKYYIIDTIGADQSSQYKERAQ